MLTKRNVIIILVLGLVILVLVIGGIWYVTYVTPRTPTTQGPSLDLGAKLYQQQNPVQGEFPEVNPFGAKNPVEELYPNPFER